MAIAVASMSLCAPTAQAQDAGPQSVAPQNPAPQAVVPQDAVPQDAGPQAALPPHPPPPPSFLLFSGTDLWRYGAFLNGGVVWSLDGLDASGFVVKTLISSGVYNYVSQGLHTTVDAAMVSASVMPGWHFGVGSFSMNLYAGPVFQDYWLKPNDPGSRLHGAYAGAQFATDVWYQPNPATMMAFSGTITSIALTGSLRAALGYRLFEAAFVGPEVRELVTGNYREYDFGAHVTAFRTGDFEWSGGSGVALTTDHRIGPYLRVNVNRRF